MNRKDLCNRFRTKVAAYILPAVNLIYIMYMTEKISFDAMPSLLATIVQKLEALEEKVDRLSLSQQSEEKDEWFNLKELCKYLPSHPAEQTVYGWTSNNHIPYHKRGKSIAFRKSEIDDWLGQGKKNSLQDIQREAEMYIKQKRVKGGRL